MVYEQRSGEKQGHAIRHCFNSFWHQRNQKNDFSTTQECQNGESSPLKNKRALAESKALNQNLLSFNGFELQNGKQSLGSELSQGIIWTKAPEL